MQQVWNFSTQKEKEIAATRTLIITHCTSVLIISKKIEVIPNQPKPPETDLKKKTMWNPDKFCDFAPFPQEKDKGRG